MKKVKWQEEWGELFPVCPYCNEWAYEKTHCVFCKKLYEWDEPPNLPKPTIIEHEDYVVVQVPSNHIQIYDATDGRLVYHASCTEKLSNDELNKHVDFIRGIRNKGSGCDEEES